MSGLGDMTTPPTPDGLGVATAGAHALSLRGTRRKQGGARRGTPVWRRALLRTSDEPDVDAPDVDEPLSAVEAPVSAPVSAPAAEDDAAGIPGFVEYTPTSLPRYAFAAVFVAASVAAVLVIFLAVQEGSRTILLLAAGLLALAMGSWWAVLSWSPTVVSIRRGVLEVARGTHGDRVDLRDTATRIDLGDDLGSRTWKAVVHRDGEPDLVIRASQVKAREFCEIVSRHRDRPRHTGENPEVDVVE